MKGFLLPQNIRKLDDHSRDARIEHKQVTQPTIYTCKLKGHKSTFCKNKDGGKKYYGCKSFDNVHVNFPRILSNSATTPNQKPSNFSNITGHQISQLSEQFPKNIKHVPLTLVKTQIIALCNTSSKATIINEKTYRSIRSPLSYPSQTTFVEISLDEVKSIGFFQDSVTIQDSTISTNIYLTNNNLIPLDVTVSINYLRETEFTLGKNGINLSRKFDDDILMNIHIIFDNTKPVVDILNREIREEVQNLVTNYKPLKIKDIDFKITILLNDDISVAQLSRLEVNMKAMKSQFERDHQVKNEQAEEKSFNETGSRFGG
ncbi:retrovirus-related Pol polyprotein from transposon 297 [Nephila pilipes]|uniref:Retrovirus-related Pol polyprotein from transposon 297 n=1 Tax=Nephila pilipes TaxID=299642 RepID=A0A8X6N3J1_NEPPI|nr:retrovirus-related Pol polyprotein from transposon 297 [Nephila pilipes]